MSYHEILGLDREPFSNSPDPDFFHSSPRHAECLRRLEIAVRLKRGLCVVMGEVGTGKTTVCRRLIRTLGYDPGVSVHLLLDPCFEDPRDFLAAVAVSFGIAVDGEDSAARIREAVQEFLLAQAGKQGKIVVLCVDEGQKITEPCLEILRELLNFETNTHKLLQIVVFAQNEFAATLRGRKNLADRVNTRVILKPLSFAETKRLIRTRLRLAAGESWKERDPVLFTRAALFSIHRACGGYPRRIMRLCHATLLEAVGREKSRAGLAEVRAARRAGGVGGMSWRAAAMAALPVAAVLAMLVGPGRERAVEMLDTGLLRMGEMISKAPEALPELPGYESVRGLIASIGVPSPEAPAVAEPRDLPAMPETAPAAVPESLPATAATPEAAPVQAAAPADVPVATPAVPAVAPAPVQAPQAPAAAETISPAVPAVAGQGLPVLPAGFSQEVQRVVPDTLPAIVPAAHAVAPAAAPAAPAVEAEPVVIEVSGVSAPAQAAAAASETAAPATSAAPAAPAVAAVASEAATLTAPSDAPRALSVSVPPLILGEMVMRQGWSLSKSAARLYGNGGKRVMSAVAAANPGIADIDQVRPGHRVAFPAREAEPLPKGARVVLLGRQTGLDEAFAALSLVRDSVPQAVLYAHFSPREGLVFDVVLDRYHADQASAEKALATLPKTVAARARVVEYADEAAVAYTALEPAEAPGGREAVRTVAQNAVTAP
jgi:general secretion pathway protein A